MMNVKFLQGRICHSHSTGGGKKVEFEDGYIDVNGLSYLGRNFIIFSAGDKGWHLDGMKLVRKIDISDQPKLDVHVCSAVGGDIKRHVYEGKRRRKAYPVARTYHTVFPEHVG